MNYEFYSLINSIHKYFTLKNILKTQKLFLILEKMTLHIFIYHLLDLIAVKTTLCHRFNTFYQNSNKIMFLK